MPENKLYLPEGLRPPVPLALGHLREALETGDILEAPVQRCGVDHTLLLNLGGVQGRIPREEAVAPWISGADRDIAVLSRVGKPTCFTVTALESDGKGAPVALLSRRAAQERAMAYFLVLHRIQGEKEGLCPCGMPVAGGAHRGRSCRL